MTLMATRRLGASFNPWSTVRISLPMRLPTGHQTRSHHASDSFAATRGALNMLWASTAGSSSTSCGRPWSTVTVAADFPHHLCACAINIHLNGLPVASGTGHAVDNGPPRETANLRSCTAYLFSQYHRAHQFHPPSRRMHLASGFQPLNVKGANDTHLPNSLVGQPVNG